MPPKSQDNKAITLNVKVPTEVHSWLSGISANNRDLLASRLLITAHGITQDPLVKCAVSPDTDGNSNEVLDMLRHIKDSWKSEVECIYAQRDQAEADKNATVVQRTLMLQEAAMSERMRAEESVRSMKAALDQVESLRKDNEKLQAIVNIMQKQANCRGNMGENIVLRTLKEAFPSYTVIDRSTMGKSDGDLHVYLGNEHDAPMVSIECKYSSNVTSKMVQTSIGHARGLKASHGDRYLGHVFVSMQTTNIPDKNAMHFEYDLIEGATVAWMGTSRFEGNEPGFLFAFDAVVKSRQLHQRLTELKSMTQDSAEIHGQYMRFIKDNAARMAAHVTVTVNMSRDYLDAEKLLERQKKNTGVLMASFYRMFEDFCRHANLDMRIKLSGKKDEEILRKVLGMDAPAMYLPDEDESTEEDPHTSSNDTLDIPIVPTMKKKEALRCKTAGKGGRKEDASALTGVKLKL